jgi:hypothetical protein
VRGTLRTYADYLGLDSASLLARHHASVALVAGSRTPSDAAATDDRPRPHRALRIVAGVVGLIVIAVLAFVVGETLARRSLLPFWEASDHGLVAWSAADESASRILVPRNARWTGFAGQENGAAGRQWSSGLSRQWRAATAGVTGRHPWSRRCAGN